MKRRRSLSPPAQQQESPTPFPWWPTLLPEMRDEVRGWMRRAQRIMLAMTCRKEWKRLVESDAATWLCARPPPLRAALLVAEEYNLAYTQACQKLERNPWHGQLGVGGDFHQLVITEHPRFYQMLLAGVAARECPLSLTPCVGCLVALIRLPTEYDAFIRAQFLAYDNALYIIGIAGRWRHDRDCAAEYIRHCYPDIYDALGSRKDRIFWQRNSERCRRQGCTGLLPRAKERERTCVECRLYFCDLHLAGSAIRRYFCQNRACGLCFYTGPGVEYIQKGGLRCAPCLDKDGVPRCHSCNIPLCDTLRDKGPCPACKGPSRMPLTPPSYDDDDDEEEEEEEDVF